MIVTTDSQHYADIAAAIREKNGEETLYRPSEMAAAILAIEGGSGIPSFTYTGTYNILDDGDGNWRIRFLTSGTLTLSNPVTVDVFLVGGGASGQSAGSSKYPSGGGGSGYTTTQSGLYLQENTEYSIVIGAGGAGVTKKGDGVGNSGGESSAFGCTAAGGEACQSSSDGNPYAHGGNGGSGGAGRPAGSLGGTDGGDGQGTAANGTGQGTTTREFGEADGTLYATGGSSGIHYDNITDAAPNTGDGGDGIINENTTKTSAAGGSGIVVIRNARGTA